MKMYQFTIWSDKGKAPISCLIEANSRLDFASDSITRKRAIKKICNKRGWTQKDLLKHGYHIYKVRIAPPEKTKPQGTI